VNGPVQLTFTTRTTSLGRVTTTRTSGESHMKRLLVLGTLVGTLLAGTAAIAAPHGRNDSHRDQPRTARHDSARNHGGADHDRRARPARDPRRATHHSRGRDGAYLPPRGYYEHRWRRGERLPTAYYGRPHVIADYRDRGLRVPPYGYQWVRIDGDAVLAAVATGIVLDAIFHVFD
jgi:Ni/Co efflux regulator RcnB